LWIDRKNARDGSKQSDLGLCPQTPGIFPLCRQDSWEAGASFARTRSIPAPGSALEVRPRRALSSAQVASGYQTGILSTSEITRRTMKNKENPQRRLDLTLPSHGSDECHDRNKRQENCKMATFTIDSENNIAAHAAVPTNLENAQAFATEKELAKLAAEWPAHELHAGTVRRVRGSPGVRNP
jgi:hypothetical protein